MAITFNCAQCGKSYTLDDSLAGKQAKCSCGTQMTVPAPRPAPAAPSPFAAPMPGSPYASPGYAPQGGGKSDKQKIVAALLCFFLGSLGIRRFYLGHMGIGVIQLFTWGGCGI